MGPGCRWPSNSEFGEANVAARVGFSVALGEHLAYGPESCVPGWPSWATSRRTLLADVAGWLVVEEADEPSAITTLAPVDGADPASGAGMAARGAAAS